MKKSKNYYQILGVDRNADQNTLKKSYRKLCMKWHPDKNKDNQKIAEEKFKEITEAYSILSDDDKRAQYDRFGHEGMNGFGNGGGGDFSDIFSQFNDIFGGGFENFFGGGGGRKKRTGSLPAAKPGWGTYPGSGRPGDGGQDNRGFSSLETDPGRGHQPDEGRAKR